MADSAPSAPVKKSAGPKKGKAPSPFLAQYLQIKAQHPDALLFFRMGDFYELFFQDAVDAAAILDITLTARGEYEGKPIPMAGVPYHAAESYLARLIRSGRIIAVCEQTETPAEAKKRGYKAIVNREIVRIVTPGTITEDALLPAKQSQALAAIGIGKGGSEIGLAVCDVSTGRFDVYTCAPQQLGETLASLPLRELLVTETDQAAPPVQAAITDLKAPLTPRPARGVTAKTGERLLKEAFNVQAIDAFGSFGRAELSACALLLDYIKLTQAGAEIRLDPPIRERSDNFLAIDRATRTSLEIDRSFEGTRKGSLLDTIDRTLSAPGARLLAARLGRPSISPDVIEARLDAAAWFLSDQDILESLRKSLRLAPDIERARTRLRLGRGGPRDLAAIAKALQAGEAAAANLTRAGAALPALISEAAHALTLTNSPELGKLSSDLAKALADNLPTLARDGGFIAPGWDPALDEARVLRDDSRKIIADMQADYSAKTGISSLKIKYNNVLGYFVDVSARHSDVMMAPPLNETFIHRQTLANNIRFSTSELAELAGRISRAEEEAKARELALFAGFTERVEAQSVKLGEFANALAALDVAAATAVWAQEVDAVRPELVDTPVFEANGLRHPVVEAALKTDGEGFTANNLSLDASGKSAPRLLLITGPNMAGKSTYLRQAALALILAQTGYYVPARSLRFGLADRIFSRVGASDDLARGRSTFMVEMVETAAILNQATPASFVILDEVGRGTSTYDGLAIAWAAIEHLHNQNACRAMFATHYHELTSLADDLPDAANASLKAKEWKNDLVFLHEVHPGPADRSYGVQVARLAGLPARAVQRAAEILKGLEADPQSPAALPLFAAAQPSNSRIAETPASPVMDTLNGIDADTLTPREALELVYRLKELSQKSN